MKQIFAVIDRSEDDKASRKLSVKIQNEIHFRVSTKIGWHIKEMHHHHILQKLVGIWQRVVCDGESGSNYSDSGQEENGELNKSIEKDDVDEINNADDEEESNKRGLW